MQRLLFAALPMAALFFGVVALADDQGKKDTPKHKNVTITKVDPKSGQITVQYKDEHGKEQQRTFELTRDVRMMDETGRVVAIDVFQSGSDALILEAEGKLKELRRPAKAHEGGRLVDAVKTLIEMGSCEDGCMGEIQEIYTMLRKLDKDHNGKIDANEVKAEANRIMENRVQAIFHRLDGNHDGKISKDEARGMLKQHFDKLDLNKDGFIDQDELRKAAQEKHDANAHQKAERK